MEWERNRTPLEMGGYFFIARLVQMNPSGQVKFEFAPVAFGEDVIGKNNGRFRPISDLMRW
jgi:hypothetical protein